MIKYFPLVFVLLLACEVEKESNNCQLSQIKVSNPDGLVATYTLYHTDGQITAVLGSFPANGQTVRYFLDWEGELLKSFRVISGTSTIEDHYYYTYHENFSTLDFYRIDLGDTTVESTVNEFFRANPEDGTYYFDNVAYEVAGGNVISSAMFEEVNGQKVIDASSQVKYTYDDQPNALRHLHRLPNLLMLGSVEARIVSQNNLTKTEVPGAFDRNAIFEYDGRGSVTMITDANTGRFLEFVYKCE